MILLSLFSRIQLSLSIKESNYNCLYDMMNMVMYNNHNHIFNKKNDSNIILIKLIITIIGLVIMIIVTSLYPFNRIFTIIDHIINTSD